MFDRRSVSESPRVVGIAGSYGGLNVGDEAILTVAISELRSVMPEAEIVVFSRNVADTRERHDVDRVVPAREAMRAEIQSEVKRLDLMLLGGGGILYDREAQSYLHVTDRAADRGADGYLRDRCGAAGAGVRAPGRGRRAQPDAVSDGARPSDQAVA